MAAQDGFKHIKVGSDEETEVVIHAGAPTAVSGGASPSPAVDASECTDASASGADVEPPDSSASHTQAAPAASTHRGTTLEDIQTSKMPKTQLVVIVVALLAIIAFTVWYVFFS